MALRVFKATDFRCLRSVELELDPVANLIVGPNASGKTSILEAIGYLGRGKSFRSAPTDRLIRHGQREFVLFGKLCRDGQTHAIGVRNGPEGLEQSVDGHTAGGAAALAEALPLQIIDPDVHALVAGVPDNRRRYLDWLAFHVEPGYLMQWRRYRRALKQRNAGLKGGCSDTELDGWDREVGALGEEVAEARARVIAIAQPRLEATAGKLLGERVSVEYRRGWTKDRSLVEALGQDRERDRSLGSTQHGPQRADLALRYDERLAKKLVSRGQQKLLSCSLVLGATEIVQAALERPLLLLLDDPAAELDREALGRLMEAVNRLGCQVVATALTTDDVAFAATPALFHVERGEVAHDG